MSVVVKGRVAWGNAVLSDWLMLVVRPCLASWESQIERARAERKREESPNSAWFGFSSNLHFLGVRAGNCGLTCSQNCINKDVVERFHALRRHALRTKSRKYPRR